MMIPDCHRRIVAAKGELEQLLETEVERPNQLISKTGGVRVRIMQFPQADLRTKEDGEECEEFLAAEAQVVVTNHIHRY